MMKWLRIACIGLLLLVVALVLGGCENSCSDDEFKSKDKCEAACVADNKSCEWDGEACQATGKQVDRCRDDKNR